MIETNRMGIYFDIPKNNTVNGKKQEPEDFLGQIAEKIKEAEGAGKTTVVETVDTKDLTLKEYKKYIYDMISSLPRNPSQNFRSVSVFISEDGFRAMQGNPEYEKWVLDTLRADFSFYDPWSGICGGSYVIHSFGATKDDYRGVSWYKNADRGEELFRKKSKDSFWERRMRHKKRMKELDKKHQAQKWKMSEMQKKMYEKEMYYRSIVQRNRIKGEDTETPERHLQELSMSYETSVLMNMLLENIGL